MTQSLVTQTTTGRDGGEEHSKYSPRPRGEFYHQPLIGEGGGGVRHLICYELFLLRVEYSILNMSRAYLRPYVKLRGLLMPYDFYVT